MTDAGGNGDADGKYTVQVGGGPKRQIFPVDLKMGDAKVVAQPDIEVTELDRHREGTRRWLAAGFSIGTLGLGLLYVFSSLNADEWDWAQAGGALNTVFTAAVGLTGSVVGYYFSSKDK